MEVVSSINLFHFLRPWWLLCLLAWLLLSYARWKNHPQKNGWSALCEPALLSYLIGDTTEQVNRSKLWFTALISAGLIAIAALAGPVWKQLPQPVFQAQSAMVIVLDLSRSMDAEDLKPSRLMRAKQKVQDILAARQEGQTGLIVFAGSAFDVVPLTTDNQAILALLASLDSSMMPSQGSMASEALKHAHAMFKRGAIRSGSVVLLCDGIDQSAIKEAKSLSAAGHTVSLLAVGTTDGAPIPTRNNNPNNTSAGGFMKDNAGNIILAKVDDEQLSALAAAGDGLFQHIRLDDADVRRLPGLTPPVFFDLYANQGNAMKTDTLKTDQWYEEGPWLLLLLLPLCAMAFRRGALFLLLLVPVLSTVMMPNASYAMDWNDLWHTPDQQALTLMAEGKNKEAAEQFKDPQWKAAAHYRAGQYKEAAEALAHIDQPGGYDQANGFYNRGNALAKTGDLQAALDAYNAALKQHASHQDAQFNRDLVEQLLKDQKQEKQSTNKGEKSDKQEQGDKGDKGDQQAGGENAPEQSSNPSIESDPSTEQTSEQQGKQSQGEPQSSDSENQPDQDRNSSKSDEPQSAEEQAQEAKTEKETEEKEQQQTQQSKQRDALEELHAQQQLLRRIPDDPGGLLRRKFLYQYQNRQGAQRQAGSNQAW